MTLPATYDELLLCSPQGSIFANRWWLDAVAPDRHKLLEIRDAGGGLLAAWPLVFQRTDDGVRYEMPPLTQKLGILFAPSTGRKNEVQSINQKVAATLIKALGPTDHFHQNFHEAYTDWLPFFWKGFSQTTRYTYVLENLGDVDGIWAALRSNHRRDIRRTERLGIGIREDLPLDQFLELNKKTFSRQGLKPLADDETVRRLDLACLVHAGRRIIAGVDKKGTVHAAVYIVWWRETAYYLMGGSDPELRGSGAQLFVLWEAIRSLRNDVKRFDFEGSMLPQVERVFRGFGATQLPYFAISRALPPPSSLKDFLKYAIEFRLKKLRRRLWNS